MSLIELVIQDRQGMPLSVAYMVNADRVYFVAYLTPTQNYPQPTYVYFALGARQ